MCSAMNGTVEQLQQLREQIYTQRKERRAATWRSYAATAAFAVIVCCVVAAFLVRMDATRVLQCQILCQIINYLVWSLVFGQKYRKAKVLEKIMLTVVNNAIQAKENTIHKGAR